MGGDLLGAAQRLPAAVDLLQHHPFQFAHLLEAPAVAGHSLLQRQQVVLGVALGLQPFLLEEDGAGEAGLLLLQLDLQGALPLQVQGLLQVLRNLELVDPLPVLELLVVLVPLGGDAVPDGVDVLLGLLAPLPLPRRPGLLLHLVGTDDLGDLGGEGGTWCLLRWCCCLMWVILAIWFWMTLAFLRFASDCCRRISTLFPSIDFSSSACL